jgi:hypothetical protein
MRARPADSSAYFGETALGKVAPPATGAGRRRRGSVGACPAIGLAELLPGHATGLAGTLRLAILRAARSHCQGVDRDGAKRCATGKRQGTEAAHANRINRFRPLPFDCDELSKRISPRSPRPDSNIGKLTGFPAVTPLTHQRCCRFGQGRRRRHADTVGSGPAHPARRRSAQPATRGSTLSVSKAKERRLRGAAIR